MYWGDSSDYAPDPGYASDPDGDGGCGGWDTDVFQPSTDRWWGADRKGGHALRHSTVQREQAEIRCATLHVRVAMRRPSTWRLFGLQNWPPDAVAVGLMMHSTWLRRRCCDPPGVVYGMYDDNWDGNVDWIVELFINSCEVSGERAPRVTHIDTLYIPGLMIANRHLRRHWGEQLCVAVWRSLLEGSVQVWPPCLRRMVSALQVPTTCALPGMEPLILQQRALQSRCLRHGCHSSDLHDTHAVPHALFD